MTAGGRPIRVLFVCTGNSARSIFAEALLKRAGRERFEVHSAGTEPKGIDPLTVRVLEDSGFETARLRSRSVVEFVDEPWDYVVTVCDQARQACPVFPGAGQKLHWGYEDPAAAQGTEEERLTVFRRVFAQMAGRVNQLAITLERGALAVDRAAGAGRDDG